ncbi:ImmA/IrrE family metallo-endopeptidase, partial [Brucella melitensis]
MSSQNYVVPPLSWDNIGQLSDAIRVQFSLAD